MRRQARERFADLFGRLTVAGPLLTSGQSQPLGAAWLPQRGRGLDLAAHGYVEQEYLVSGVADVWTWDAQLCAVPVRPEPFTTRVLVRRPADGTRFSGAVQLEPHHPDDDRAMSWGMIGPWLVRSGHAHVGVTHDPASVDDLIAFDLGRYGRLRISHPSQRWDILGLMAAAISQGALPAFADVEVTRIVMSGWSMTGTFCRTFLGEGFHDRATLGARPAVDGYVICISSGGAGRAGYASLRDGITLPLEDPRRTVGSHGVPVVELLSEGESETHHSVLRDDGDAPEDRYRLYQAAGTGHLITGVRAINTNRRQLEDRGFPALGREINEHPSDARMDLVARAVFQAVDGWIASGTAPPRGARFEYDSTGEGPRGLMVESRPLARDDDGNVIGGIRTPWVEVPAATYLPHSTPRPGSCQPGPHAPYRDPALLADLIAHMRPFGAAELRRRYGSIEGYRARLEASARGLAAAGWLLAEDLPELLA
jgi:hypothetical protein